jgi:hypothetical protein
MATLHTILHNNGKSGMCNSIMSMQLGIVLKHLGGYEKVIFYYDGHPYLFPTSSTLEDVLYVGEGVEMKPISELPNGLHELPSAHQTVYFKDQEPDEDFLNGREKFNITSAAKRFSDCVLTQSLGYYSYVVCMSRHEREEIFSLISSGEYLSFNEEIFVKATLVVESLPISTAAAFHIRRADYNVVSIAKNKDFSSESLKSTVVNHMVLSRCPDVFFVTDEKDDSYFTQTIEELSNRGVVVRFLDKEIEAMFPDTPAHQRSAIALVASVFSKYFVGTMYSTFTGIIQQMRHMAGYDSNFRFLFSQDEPLKLKPDGRIDYGSFGTYSWNRLNNTSSNSSVSPLMKSILFWAFEHPEVGKIDTGIQHAISIHPDFLSAEECRMIISKFQFESDHKRENRDRSILNTEDPGISKIVDRVATKLGMDRKRFDTTIQFFKQYAGGQTFLHCDSLHEDDKGRRVGSVLFYLNTGFVGSNINFPYSRVTIQPSRGGMIVYPLVDEWSIQSKYFAHEASVITQGTKYMCYLSIKER